MKMKYELIIEKADDGYLGRVSYEDDLLIDEADTILDLEERIKNLLKDFHGLNPSEIEFEHKYDIAALFNVFSYLKISSLADLAGINSSLLRQYVSGKKNPSSKQTKKLENAIRHIANELLTVQVLS